MRDLLRAAVASVALMTLGLGIVLPLAFTGVATVLMPHRAAGSLVHAGDRVLGSGLIGQDFRGDRWFHPRPSATSGPDPENPRSTSSQPYNAAASGASNLGPTSATLLTAVQARVAKSGPAPVPADAATASGSGLDPHISPQHAQRQVARVAAARGLPPERVARLVLEHIERRELGVLGVHRVNVLHLNSALDALR